MTKWQIGDRLYSNRMETYGTVRSTDKYGNGKNVIEIQTDAGSIGSGTQAAFEAGGDWVKVK